VSNNEENQAVEKSRGAERGTRSASENRSAAEVDLLRRESHAAPEPSGDREVNRPISLPTTFAGLRDLVLRVDAGDKTVQPLIRLLIHSEPDTAMWLLAGDLVTQNQRALVESFAGSDPERTEAIHNQVRLLRQELAGPSPSAIELALIDRLLICWLQVQLCDHEFLQAKGEPVKHADHRDRLRNRAHRRFLSAVKTLATVRKLNIPAIQVNIGDQQINVAGSQELRRPSARI